MVDTFFPALDTLSDQLVELEEKVLAGEIDVQGRILAIRKELIEARRIIGPMRDAMVILLRRDLGLFSDQAQRYLPDVYDHLIRLTETVEDYQEVLAGTLDANATICPSWPGATATPGRWA